MQTYVATPKTITRQWYVIDATNKTLGRLASQVASRLRGKHKAIYTPHADTGDFIVVINTDKINMTGKKAEDKIYYRHSGYVGHLKTEKFAKLQARVPGRAFEMAVKNMLPRGPLGRQMFRKLKVYGGNEHPHQAQQPKPLEIEE